MDRSSHITIHSFCSYHEVEISFIATIQEEGLLGSLPLEEEQVIGEEELLMLERIVRLYKGLNINPEGIGAVLHLLDKIDELQKENQELRKRLDRLG
jgi:chaperone modulatory protein CbpM